MNSFLISRKCPMLFGRGTSNTAAAKMKEMGCRKVLMPNGQICLVCRIYELAGLDGIACNVVINAEFVQCVFKTALGVIARGRHCGIALEHVVHALYIVGGAGVGAFGKVCRHRA